MYTAHHNLKSSSEGDAVAQPCSPPTETGHQEEAEAGPGPELQRPVAGEGRDHPPDHL